MVETKKILRNFAARNSLVEMWKVIAKGAIARDNWPRRGIVLNDLSRCSEAIYELGPELIRIEQFPRIEINFLFVAFTSRRLGGTSVSGYKGI